ncbi:MAG: hypothetical protein ACI4DK_07235 [Lachnospiraceae bacterium]
MKKIVSIIITICLVICLIGCAFTGSKNYTKNTNNRLIPVPGEQDLYYDISTKVVYIIFNECAGNEGYGYMSPYYADNGFPYSYNVETNELEEINIIEEMIKW